MAAGFSGDWANASTTFDFDVVLNGDVVGSAHKTGSEIANASNQVQISLGNAKPGEYQLVWNSDYNGAGSIYGDTTGEVSAVLGDSVANKNWGGFTPVVNADKDADGDYYFTETGKAVDFKVTDLLGLKDESVSKDDYKVVYFVDTNKDGVLDSNDAKTFSGDPKKEGTAPSVANASNQQYLMTVWPDGELADGAYANVTEPIVIPFEIGPAAAQLSASLYEVDGTYADDTTDTDFTYVGKDYLAADGQSHELTNLGLVVDGDKAVLKDSQSNTTAGQYYVKTVNGSTVSNGKFDTNSTVQGAGTYKLGIADSTGNVVFNLELTVDPFDLSGAKVTAKDMTAGSTSTPELTVVNGDDTLTSAAANALDVEIDSFTAAKGVTQPVGTPSDFSLKGSYGITVSPTVTNGKADPNYTGSAEATAKAFGSVDSGFKYGTSSSDSEFEDWNDGKGKLDNQDTTASYLVFDKSKDEAFDISALGSTGMTGTPKSYFDVVFYDAEGNVVASPDAAGAYTAVVSVKSDLSYTKGGSDTLSFRVAESTDANVYFTVDGKPAGASAQVSYTGEPVDYSVAVKADGKTVPASDYKVAVTEKTTGKAVDEIVDPGTYVVTVTSDKYGIKTTCEITVIAAKYEGIEIDEQAFGYDQNEYERPYSYNVVENGAVSSSKELTVAQETGIAYTGEAVAPVVKGFVTNKNGEKVYTVLPEEYYEVSYTTLDKDGKTVAVKAEDLKAVGEYTATVELTQAGKDANISSLGTTTDTFDIVDTVKGGFTDVKASEWYADEATKALQLGYMTGLSGTSMLLPNADITRADVAMVLMRMAGGNPDLAKDETYPTKFSDVAADAYYAKAIDWAYKAGIITGYEGSLNFGPNDLVTREQLATMLGRFAENVMGEDVSAGSMEGYVDAASVQEFAVEGMSWCVENGVFGVNTDVLDPQGNASRAQVAAIAVRVMPAVEK